MAVLKRIKASTLMETLVSTVLIVIVFMVASMVLNSLFAGSISQHNDHVQQELLQLQYLYKNGKLEVPYYDELGPWEIVVTQSDGDANRTATFVAAHSTSDKKITFEIRDE